MPCTRYDIRALHRLAIGPMVLLASLSAGFARAQTPSTDPEDRTSDFIERSLQATDLYNNGHYPEALAMYQTLVQSYSDQDTDSFAATGLADCLAAMGRIDEARAAYQSIHTQDAAQRAAIRERLAELDLKGTITEELLNRLRAAAHEGGQDAFVESWRLGRALQKRSADLLNEAAQAFRQAATAGANKICTPEHLEQQAAYLDELLDDLKFFISEIDSQMKLRPPPPADANGKSDKPVTVERHVKQTMQMPGGRSVGIQVDRESGSDHATIKVDGKELHLTETDLRLLQRHQDRINAIILEAAGQASPRAEAHGDEPH